MHYIARMILIVCALNLAACEESQSMKENAVSEQEPKVIHEMADLEEWIELPAKPDSVKWTISQDVAGSRDSGLTALLHFTPEDYENILRDSEKHNVVTDAIVDKAAYEEWAPEEVKKEFEVEPFSEYSIVLVDRPALRPNLFVDPDGRSPYIHGYVYPLGKGYIMVTLSTM